MKIDRTFFFSLINMQTNSPLMPREKLLKYGVEALEDQRITRYFLTYRGLKVALSWNYHITCCNILDPFEPY